MEKKAEEEGRTGASGMTWSPGAILESAKGNYAKFGTVGGILPDCCNQQLPLEGMFFLIVCKDAANVFASEADFNARNDNLWRGNAVGTAHPTLTIGDDDDIADAEDIHARFCAEGAEDAAPHAVQPNSTMLIICNNFLTFKLLSVSVEACSHAKVHLSNGVVHTHLMNKGAEDRVFEGITIKWLNLKRFQEGDSWQGRSDPTETISARR